MRCLLLELTILKVLDRIPHGSRELALANEVELLIDQKPLTYEMFSATLSDLQAKQLIESESTLLGDTKWKLTELGRKALAEY